MKTEELTNAFVARYVGGQAEVRNYGVDYRYRGEIRAIAVRENGLCWRLEIAFDWQAQDNNYRGLRDNPPIWVVADMEVRVDYSF